MLEELAQIIEECTSKLGDEQSNFADLQNELDELNDEN